MSNVASELAPCVARFEVDGLVMVRHALDCLSKVLPAESLGVAEKCVDEYRVDWDRSFVPALHVMFCAGLAVGRAGPARDSPSDARRPPEGRPVADPAGDIALSDDAVGAIVSAVSAAYAPGSADLAFALAAWLRASGVAYASARRVIARLSRPEDLPGNLDALNRAYGGAGDADTLRTILERALGKEGAEEAISRLKNAVVAGGGRDTRRARQQTR